MVGSIAGILFLMALLVLLVASIRRIVIAYRQGRKADIVAIIGLVVVLLVLACIFVILIGPTIDGILPGGVE